jgi:hypothetical protein
MKRISWLTVGVVGVMVVCRPGAADAVAGTLEQSPGGSVSRAVYDTTAWTLKLDANLGAADAAAGVCVDTIFDWEVVDANGRRHYDARVLRNCDAGPLRRGSWVEMKNGLTATGVRKSRGCLVTGTDASGRWGKRTGCETLVGANVADCGSNSVACFIRKGGVITRTGWSNPLDANA